MSKDTKVIVAVVAALVLPIAAGALFEWPGWVTGVLIAVLLVAGGFAALRPDKHFGPRRRPGWQEDVFQPPVDPEPRHVPVTPPPPASRPVTSVRLPSSVEGIPFTLSCTVLWHQQANGHAEPGALAVQAVLHRARQVARAHHPEEDTTVHHALAAALSTATPDGSNTVRAWAVDLAVTIDEEHSIYLRELVRLRRERLLGELRIENERAVRSYLGEDVLASVGSTVVWWLAKDSSKVQETVDLIGSLARLSAAANDKEIDEAFEHLVPADQRPARDEPFHGNGFAGPGVFVVDSAGVVDSPAEPMETPESLLPDPEDDGNALFGRTLVDALDKHGHPDLADKARDRYGVDEWAPQNETADDGPVDDHREDTGDSDDPDDPATPSKG
ncbi:hypothetical protein [Actinokineospora globicatena]|uniref:hypothetical protein n=1 Tax=Actinokineospora globicatena TaxID=103729 RepID=UPI0020A44C8E|nr:hypothetical protein [Actinokineospora globicatena]MCP2301751.1 hypothetical protein [Actinokineospora globicatena]GLW76591.1 hypothetical protein Aglo01_10730 [Actinokineospora globicatena]GLW83425.1 hypothetical protein Aglo02_10650 [Actinokineospora globicatena]